MQSSSLLVVLACSLGSCLAVHETFSGMGNMKCYGDMSITVRSGDDEGFLTCSPAWGSAVAPPQVIKVVILHPDVLRRI